VPLLYTNELAKAYIVGVKLALALAGGDLVLLRVLPCLVI
jgi:hypothetical protein